MRSTSSFVTTQQASKPSTTLTSQQTRKRLRITSPAFPHQSQPSTYNNRRHLSNFDILFLSSRQGAKSASFGDMSVLFDRCYSGSAGRNTIWRGLVLLLGPVTKVCMCLTSSSRLSKPAKTFHHARQPANAQAPPASLQPLLSNNLSLAITTIADTFFIYHLYFSFFFFIFSSSNQWAKSASFKPGTCPFDRCYSVLVESMILRRLA